MFGRNDPFNLELLKLTPEQAALMKPVRSLDMFDGATKNFHEDGLFSTSIFGRFGDDRRDLQFSYIDLKTTVLHPLIFDSLIKLKGLYRGIMSGKEYAVWDEEKQDFVASDIVNGETGYDFFIKHWKDINFVYNDSLQRKERIDLINKSKNKAEVDKIMVLPAGLRDVEIGDDNRIRFHESNDKYIRLIGLSNHIARTTNPNDPAVNQTRASLQNVFNETYDLFKGMVSGKNGFYQGKFASRRIFNGTQNVITAMDPSTSYLGSPNSITVKHTVLGLFQQAKAIEPKTKHFLKSGILNTIFAGGNKAYLVNPKTLEAEYVTVSSKTIDYWTSVEGLGRVIESYREASLRNKPIMVEGYYLCLTYTGDEYNGTFRLFSDMSTFPDNLDKKNVHPTTLAELLYVSGYKEWNNYPGYVTRYPIAGLGSIYPSMPYVKVTIKGEVRKELGPDWKIIGDDHTAYEFPSYTKPVYLDSLSPHLTRLSGLTAD